MIKKMKLKECAYFDFNFLNKYW